MPPEERRSFGGNGNRYLDSLESRMDRLGERVEKRMDRLGERVDTLSTKVDGVGNTTNTINGTLNAWRWMVPVAVLIAGFIGSLITALVSR